MSFGKTEKLAKNLSFIELVEQISTHAAANKIALLVSEDYKLKGNMITLNGNVVANFGSCSYLGLEFDERLIHSAKEALDRYGTQFSESRAYVSIKLYEELENLLEKIFGHPAVAVPTTTLGHIAAIPVLVGSNDAIIIDHQAHTSVQVAVQLAKARGTHVEIIRHNRMDLLEERIKDLESRYAKVWYMADGIYSMYGDACPVKEIIELLNKYSCFHFYLDDAHGMSYFGKNGRGYVLSLMEQMNEKTVIATSFAKAFATGGAALIFPNKEMALKVRYCGTTLITSGPMQPAALGAAVAASKIHLSDEIYSMQEDLKGKILFANLMLKKYKLPLISSSEAAIFFVGVSLPKLGYNMVKRMLSRGFYVNLGIFPAVPMRNTGLRFTITRLHSFTQIEEMVATMAEEFPKALAEEGMVMEQIYRAFKMLAPEEAHVNNAIENLLNESLELSLEHKETILDIDKELWDSIFAGKGNFDWHGCAFLENSFSNNPLPENNWKFDYIIIRDNQNNIVAATFLTTTIWKDDMLSPAEISALVEQKRESDPYYLTSKVLSTGSLLTEGEHVFIDKSSPFWKDALSKLFNKMHFLQDENQANTLMVRDFIDTDKELDELFVDNGFFKAPLPDANIIPSMNWATEEEFYWQLSKRSRKHFREDVGKNREKFIIQNHNVATPQQIKGWHQLYLNVKQKNLGLNTFTLPLVFFENAVNDPHWQITTLSLKEEYHSGDVSVPVAVSFCYKSDNCYVPVLLGLDYSYQKKYKVYQQVLYNTVMEAKRNNCKMLSLGFSATTEKKKVGAQPYPTYAYMQLKDSYNLQVLSEMEGLVAKK